jgi:hypothetical protein
VHTSVLPDVAHDGEENVPGWLEVNETVPLGALADEELGTSLTVAVHTVCWPALTLVGLHETPVWVGVRATVAVLVCVTVVVGPVTVCVAVLTDVETEVVVLVETEVTVVVLTDAVEETETETDVVTLVVVVVTWVSGLIVRYEASCPPVQTLKSPVVGSTSSSISSFAPIA